MTEMCIRDRDTGSMKKRVELANGYGLAGIAAWRRGFETEDIWEAIDATLRTD